MRSLNTERKTKLHLGTTARMLAAVRSEMGVLMVLSTGRMQSNLVLVKVSAEELL